MESRLTEAAINDDTTDLEATLGTLSEENALMLFLVACQSNSVNFVRVVMKLKPDLAWRKNLEGQCAIHIACEKEHTEIVKVLLETNHRLCFLRDGRLWIPLHVATVKGNISLMKVLIKACPESASEVTYLDETSLQLAAKNDQIGAFQVLMEDVLERKQWTILHHKDYQGNNVLHIAVTRRLIEILRLLLVDNPKHAPLVRVNTRNARGFTPLDLHFHNITENQDIADLLSKAGAVRGSVIRPVPGYIYTIRRNICFSNSSLVLTASVLIAGSTYTSIFNLDNTANYHVVKGNIEILKVRDVIVHPGLLPNVFYTIMLMTVAFTLSMVGVVVPLWTIIKKLSFCFQALSLLCLATFFFSYAFIMEEKVPKFWVTTAKSHIKCSSFWLVWLYGLPLILLIFFIWLSVNLSILGKLEQPEDE